MCVKLSDKPKPASGLAVRYNMALCGANVKVGGSHYVEGNIFEERIGLLKSVAEKLITPPGKVWVCTGWNNPLAEKNNWIDL